MTVNFSLEWRKPESRVYGVGQLVPKSNKRIIHHWVSWPNVVPRLECFGRNAIRGKHCGLGNKLASSRESLVSIPVCSRLFCNTMVTFSHSIHVTFWHKCSFYFIQFHHSLALTTMDITVFQTRQIYDLALLTTDMNYKQSPIDLDEFITIHCLQ